MKATRNTPERLILDDTPWFIVIAPARLILAFAGASLDAASTGGETLWFGLGFAAFCLFVRRVRVTLDRPGGSIVIRRQSVFGSSQVEHFLADLSRAEVESATSRSEGRTRTLFSPVLVLDGGLSDAIKAWLHAAGPAKVDSGGQSA